MTEEITNIGIAMYALYQLGGAERKVHTEKVAELCHQLARRQFSWRLREFSHIPDKEVARIALHDARKVKYGKLVVGRAGVGASGKEADGWLLTAEGVRWVIQNEKRIVKALGTEVPGARRPDIQRVKKRFAENPIYLKFLRANNLNDVNPYELTDMLSCPPDADMVLVRKRYERLQTEAALLQDERVTAFMKQVWDKLSKLLV